MHVKILPNVAINTRADANESVARFYQSLGFAGRSVAPEFTVLSPSAFGCYVVSWEPPPRERAELCLQIETDDLPALRQRVIDGGGTIEFFRDDPNNPSKQHMWFRDPGGILVNAVSA
ncbi:MAG: VOC family protein [Anaerolineae bacterium]|nr:VOC family protein [Phycisphaerae bacterium]